MAKDVEPPKGFVLDDHANTDSLPVGFKLDGQTEAPANPMGDASPRDVIRNAAMGRIDRKKAESYLQSVGLDPSLIDNFGNDMTQGQRIAGAAMAPGMGLTAGFGEEIASRLAALPHALPGGLTYDEAQRAIQQNMRENYDIYQKNKPVEAVGLEMAGVIPAAASAARALPQGIKNITGRMAANVPYGGAIGSFGTGAVSGAIYGAGTGEGDINTRAGNAGEMGLYGGAGGLAGAAAGRALAPRIAGLGKRAKAIFGAAPAELSTGSKDGLTRGFASGPAANIGDAGQLIPLSKGARLQDPKKLALENMARSGAIDDASQARMLQADYAQQDKIKSVLDNIAGGAPEGEALAQVGKTLQSGYKDIKRDVNKLYSDAQVIRKVFVKKAPISEGFVPNVKNIIYKQGFDAESFTPETERILGKVTGGALADAKISAINLEKMEFWRRQVSNRANDAKGTAEGVLLGKVLKEYDNFMGRLPAEALKAGDDDALEAIQKARKMRRAQGVLFETNKVIKNIVQSDNLTNEELANLVLTGTGRGRNINAGTAKNIRAIKRAAGVDDEDVIVDLRRGTMARVIDKATSNLQRQGTDIQMIDPGKLLKELDNIAANKTFMKEVFADDSANVINGLRKDLRKIVSGNLQPGAKNYSNTAYTLLSALRKLPLGLSSFAGFAEIGLKPLAEKGAGEELERSLSDILKGAQVELIGKGKYYGSVVGGAQAGERGSNAERDGYTPIGPQSKNDSAKQDTLNYQAIFDSAARVQGQELEAMEGKPSSGQGDGKANNGDIGIFVDKIIHAESSGNPNAKSKTSSATGLGQFVKGTWLSMIKKHRPDLAEGKTNKEILALRTNAEISREMTRRYAEDNKKLLERYNAPISQGALYLAHFLGPRTAAKVLNGDYNGPIEDYVGEASINANKSVLKGKRVKDVIQWANKKMEVS